MRFLFTPLHAVVWLFGEAVDTYYDVQVLVEEYLASGRIG